MAGPCVIEGEDMALRIAERIKHITDKLQIPYIFKGSYRKANRSRLDSFTGIGDDEALRILQKVGREIGVPTVTDIHESDEAARAAECVDVLQIPGLPLPPDRPAGGRRQNRQSGEYQERPVPERRGHALGHG